MKPTLNPALKSFWKTKARTKVIYGGRASSKTWDAAGVAVALSKNYTMKFLCTRQFQNRITESVYTVIKTQIERFSLKDQFTITNNRITHNTTGSEFVFYGLWRNIDEIKSLEGIDVCWIEEAHNLTQEQWDILEPTIRKEGSEFWIIFNPRLRTDFVYKNFVINTPASCITRKINFDENPFLSQTMLDLIEAKKKEDYEDYRHIYLGEPRAEEYNSLFSYEMIDNAMTNDPNVEVDRSGVFVYALDVARYGSDNSALSKRKGYHTYELSTRQGISTMELASWVAYQAKQESRMPDAIIVDTIGVGAGVADRLTQMGFPVIEGNGSMKADNEEYLNKRTEMYFNLKNFLARGGRLPKDDELLEELVSITYAFTESGKVKLASKDSIKADLGRSPDKADTIAMQLFTEIVPQEMLEMDDFYTEGSLDNELAW
jgi:phage terminase large subunit